MVDVGIGVNKDVENQTKSSCGFIRTEVETETKINPRQSEDVSDWKYNKLNNLIEFQIEETSYYRYFLTIISVITYFN